MAWKFPTLTTQILPCSSSENLCVRSATPCFKPARRHKEVKTLHSSHSGTAKHRGDCVILPLGTLRGRRGPPRRGPMLRDRAFFCKVQFQQDGLQRRLEGKQSELQQTCNAFPTPNLSMKIPILLTKFYSAVFREICAFGARRFLLACTLLKEAENPSLIAFRPQS